MKIFGMQKQHLAHLVLLSCQFSFSGWHLIGSLAMKHGADPFVFVLYREIISSIVMYLFVHLQHLKIHIEPRDYRRFLFLGFCSFVNVVGAMLALKYISASRFAIFQPSIPCIATVIAIVLGMERWTWLKGAGIALAVSGAIVAEAWSSSDGGDAHEDSGDLVIGTGIVAAQVVSMASLIVFSKPLLSRYAPSVVTFAYYSLGTVITVFLFSAFAYSLTSQDLYFDGFLLPWLAMIYAVCLPTVYNYNAMTWANKLLPPSTTTVYMTFQPIGTVLLSFVFLGQLVTLSEGLGGALVVLGLLVTVYAQQRDQYLQAEGADRSSSADDLLLAQHAKKETGSEDDDNNDRNSPRMLEKGGNHQTKDGYDALLTTPMYVTANYSALHSSPNSSSSHVHRQSMQNVSVSVGLEADEIERSAVLSSSNLQHHHAYLHPSTAQKRTMSDGSSRSGLSSISSGRGPVAGSVKGANSSSTNAFTHGNALRTPLPANAAAIENVDLLGLHLETDLSLLSARSHSQSQDSLSFQQRQSNASNLPSPFASAQSTHALLAASD